MFYQMQEGYLTLEGQWQDRSVNVLVANHLTVKGANLTVTREQLPAGTGLLDYLSRQKEMLAVQLAGFNLESDVTHIVDGRQAQFLEINWHNLDTPMHQMIMAIQENESLMSITATIPGCPDDAMREALLSIMKGFRFGPATPAAGGEQQ